MTTETITIVVNERGARVVKRNIEDIGRGAEKSSKGVDILGRSIFTLKNLIGSVLIFQTVKLIDTYTNLQNRLKLVTKGTAELNTVTGKLFDISNETRSSYEATAEVYARTALATKELGLSQQETLDFTKSLNQAVILSGASAQEASAGLIQLSQGLASGTLRGDELRSVLEQLPAVADVIAKQLGVTRGELRKMGEEGKITAKDIITSFKSARQELENKFAKTVPTIGQAFIVLRNNIQEYIGTIDTALGLSQKLAQGLILLADNIDVLAKAIGLATAAFIAFKLAANAAAIASLTTIIVGNVVAFIQLAAQVRNVAGAIALLNATLLVNPFVLIATAITVTITAVVLFRKQLLDLLRKAEFFGTNMVEVFAFMADLIKGIFAGLFGVIEGFFNKIKVLLVKNADTFNKFLKPFGREIAVGDIIGSDVLQVMESAGRSAGENFQKGFDDATANGLLAKELSRGFNVPDAPGVNLGLTGEDLTPNAAIQEALKRRKELLEDLQAPMQDYLTAIEDLNVLYENGLIPLETYNEALAGQEEQFLQNFEATNFADGFIAQIRRMQLETRNASARMGTDLAKVFGPGGTLSKGIGDAVAQSIVFGKSFTESIRQVAQQILSQLISALIQVGVNMLLNATLGKTLMAASTAASAAAAGATASAWAPAAAMASLASFGANAGAAQAGIATTVATAQALSKIGGGLPGFELGGFTGNLSTKQVAGVVHGQEFVMNAAATARNRSTLEAMNRGKDYEKAGGKVEVSIINEIPDAEFETEQVTEGKVEIIARRIVREDAPGVIARDFGNPNSKTSKALQKNTQTQRRRS